jgi:HSP20 family protein
MLHYHPAAAVASWPGRPGAAPDVGRGVDEIGRAGRAGRGFAGANVYESAEAYLIELPLPGVTAADVALTVQDDRLTLKATRHWAAPPNAQPLARGFGPGELQQTVTLPGDVAADGVQAHLQDGILRLELPKAAGTRPRAIPVTGAGARRGTPSAASLPAPAAAGAAPATGAARRRPPRGAGR